MNKQQELDNLLLELETAVPNLPLANVAQDIVPGEGDPNSYIMLIGEAPGQKEAEQRRPFIGRSGKFLRKTLEEQNLAPETVWISNIVKVRPPENRDPSVTEIAAYQPFLDKEISILSPKIVVTLGRFSMAKFLPEVKISAVHGKLHLIKWNNNWQYVLPMYHPAAGLRNGKVRKSFVEDFQKVPKILAWIDEQADNSNVEGEVINDKF